MTFKRELITDTLYVIFDWAKMNLYLCILIYVGLAVCWITLCLPGSLLTLCAGVLFTEAIGKKGVFLAWSLGVTNQCFAGLLSFCIGRFLLYDFLRGYFESKRFLKSVEGAIKANGYKISFLLRFAAFMPAMLLNYGLSVTSIRVPQFVFGYFGCMLWELSFSYYGYCIGDLLNVLTGKYKASVKNSSLMIGLVIASFILSLCILKCTYNLISKYDEKEEPTVVPIEENEVLSKVTVEAENQ